MNSGPRHPRRTPPQSRRLNSSPENRIGADGVEAGTFTPRGNPKMTRPVQHTNAPAERRLALSSVIGQTINVMKEREEQRHKLINTLVVVQVLVTAAVAFGFHDKPGFIFPIALASVGVYLVALVAGYVLKNDSVAAYILVFGGLAAVAAQVVAAMLTGNPEETGHIALFFVAVMIESGLLLSPQLTVIVVTAALALTSALLLLIPFNKDVSGPQIYLIVLYTLSPMALTAIVAWLLSHFINATVVTAQHAQELEFRQAQVQQMKAHEQQRQQQLDDSITAIQSAIAQAITGDYTVRVPVSSGDLEVVENSLNLLLDTFDSMAQAQQDNARMAGAVLPITEGLNRLNDSITPLNPIRTDTPFDDVSAMVSRVADKYNRRLARLQEQLGNLSAGVVHSRKGLANASDEFDAAKRQTGALISRADALQVSLQKLVESLAKARRMLATVLPNEITQTAEPGEAGDPSLRGLGIGIEPGLTSEFDVLPPTTPAEAGIAPLTMPLPSVHPDDLEYSDEPAEASYVASSNGVTGAIRASGASGASGAYGAMSGAAKAYGQGDELPVELVEVWHQLLQIGEELTQQERTITALVTELGVLSRTVRSADAGIGWTLTALDTLQKSSDTAQQSSAHNPTPDDPADGPADPQDTGGFIRPANPARPLWEDGAPNANDQPMPRGSLSGSDLLGGGEDSADSGASGMPGADDNGDLDGPYASDQPDDGQGDLLADN